MIVDKYGRVAGSIDLAQLAELYAQTDDEDLKAHFRQVAAENGASLSGTEADFEAVVGAQPTKPASEVALDDLRAQADALGIKVDRRWGEQRLRDEIAAAQGTESEDEG